RAVNNKEKLSGDIFYSGNPSKWLKMVNSFKLHVLINLALKEKDGELDVVNRFKTIVNNPDQYPIMTSNSDNLQITFRDKEGEKKPFYVSGFEVYAVTTSFVIDKLKSLQDYRLFYYADPLAGHPEAEFDSYAGLDPSAPNENNLSLFAQGKASSINKLYYNKDYPQGFPYVILGYADVQFIFAEAAARGWIDNADQFYKNGITASMNFRFDNIDAKWVHGMPLTSNYISSYLNKPEIQLPSDTQGMLKQIMWQKYLGSLFQNDWNVYFDYRRTGYPEFPINPATNKNEIADKMPLRWLYPDAEYNHNQENIQQAVTRQFDGKDDENQMMWILKK
ncbi:MAG TPA: SusD/RagB family nutrient-binding outer membrane lipoprotein, partial [Bacteroidales bacterium]|nr:SusD/RagB family nutrient-binding outer membrane lipoprotein [Bacteroidales bacterium]